MRHATHNLRDAAVHAIAWVGIEGAFLIVGTAVLALGAALVHPAGPYAVIGLMLVAYGLALAAPRRA